MVGLGSAPDLDGGVAVAVPDLSLADDGVDGGGVVGGGLGADAAGVEDDDTEEDVGLRRGVVKAASRYLFVADSLHRSKAANPHASPCDESPLPAPVTAR